MQLGEARKRRTATPEELTKKKQNQEKSQKEHRHTRTVLDEHGIEWDETYVF